MEAFFVSVLTVALGEIGDKTQLLALILAARFRRPLPIVLGILTATIANHTLAGFIGEVVRTHLPTPLLHWVLGALFLATAAWSLIPDKIDPEASPRGHYGIYATTVVGFFLAEMGDKTQLATAMLAAHFGALLPVVSGTTVGMLIADVPVVFLAKFAAPKIPIKLVRMLAAAVFAGLGISALLGL